MLTYEEITKNEAIRTYIIRADESLAALGFTEHSFAHVMHVAQKAGYILQNNTYFNEMFNRGKYLNILLGGITENEIPSGMYSYIEANRTKLKLFQKNKNVENH